MKYTHNYSKLKKEKYTTIRRNKKGRYVGKIEKEIYPSGNHDAQIIRILKLPLNSISLYILQEDTDLETREEINELFQSFYQKPIDFVHEDFFIFFMDKDILTLDKFTGGN